MEQKTNYTVIITSLLIGLFIGYVVGVNTSNINYRMMWSNYSYPTGHMNYMMGTNPGSADRMDYAMNNMMSGLYGKTGADFEKAFLAEMIVHHEGAVVMAEALLKNTSRPELVKLGNDIITAQTGEISMMKKWLAEWFQ